MADRLLCVGLMAYSLLRRPQLEVLSKGRSSIPWVVETPPAGALGLAAGDVV